MKNIKGPALFLAQFADDSAPFNSWESITAWAADCGYKGVQSHRIINPSARATRCRTPRLRRSVRRFRRTRGSRQPDRTTGMGC